MSVAPFKNDAELVAFARKFFANRVETFCKDIAICKTPDARGEHAYFPALIICIAFADLLSGLYAGKLHRHGLKELKQYAAKFMEPEYTSDRSRLEILYECLRHKVAHLAYPYAVFDTDRATSKTFFGQPRRRVTWSVHETEQRPAIAIIDYPTPRQLVQTPTPWPVSYDCRIEVSVPSLAKDIVESIDGYLRHLESDWVARTFCQMHGGLLSAINFHTVFGAFRNRMVIILDTNRVGNDEVCLVGHGGALLVLFESPTLTL